MKKKICIILVVVAVILCGVGAVLLFNVKDKDNGKEKETVSKEDDLNYLDRSDMEKEVRKNTNNPYYTINTSRVFATNRTYDGLDLTDPWLVRISKDLYSFSCILHNNTDKEYLGQAVIVRFVDKDGEVLDEVETRFFSVPAGGMSNLYADTKVNVLDAYDFEIVPKNS